MQDKKLDRKQVNGITITRTENYFLIKDDKSQKIIKIRKTSQLYNFYADNDFSKFVNILEKQILIDKENMKEMQKIIFNVFDKISNEFKI